LKRIPDTFVAVMLALSSWVVQAAPDQAVWRTVSVLGANNDHYYVLVAQRDYPGSYYSYRERILVEKYATRVDRKVFSAVVSDIQYTNDDPEKDEWKSAAKASPAFDLAGYIAEEKIVPLYPISLASDYRVAYLKDGLHLERKGKSVLLMPLGKSRLVVGEELRLSGLYYKSGFILLKVAQGDQTIDQDYLEVVLPISKDMYSRATKQLSD
jgi:hypothetical protein